VALQRLKDGNLRFCSGRPQRGNQSVARVKELASGQYPFATILGCSDSRVPPEVIFDQGIGDLFIVRVAGNVISPEVLGSLEYAALHLHTKAFVVLGHEDCGAVKAALGSNAERHTEPPEIQTLLAHIDVAIHRAHLVGDGDGADKVTQIVGANAKQSAEELKDAVQKQTSDTVVRAAVYQIGTGKVQWL
jgi:carbonic anhydrase